MMKLSIDRKVLLLVSAVTIAVTLAGGLLGSTAATEGTYDYLRVFNEALYLAMNNYVEPVQIEAIMEGAYRGMLESLDPGNEYLTPAEYQKATRGENAGPAEIGVNLSKRHGYAIVVSAIPGGPAAASGVKSGDILLSIDGRTTRLMGAWEAGQALRGKSGSKAVLVLNPADGGDRKTLILERKVLSPPQPQGSFVAPEVGVVRIVGIREGDARRLDQAIASLRSQGMKRLLLDLRGCASESLAEPIGMASLFVKDGVIVSVTDRFDGDKAYRADGRRRAWSGPLALLVDGGTSRGCEALTAGLRDAAGAAILGERTWGTGTVSSILPLRNGDGVILAVGSMHSPSGKEWNGKGIDPDLVIAADGSATGDSQRQKAIEYLRGVSTPKEREAA
jgi:carboxyl-terminal processing protease